MMSTHHETDSEEDSSSDREFGSDTDAVTNLYEGLESESDEDDELEPAHIPLPKKRKGYKEPELEWTEDDAPMDHFDFDTAVTYFVPENFTTTTTTASDYLNLYFTDELLEIIVSESNKFAELEIKKNSPFTSKCRLRFWKPLHLEELKKFLGLCILTGIMKLPKLRNYWSKSLYSNKAFPSVMSFNRFSLILRMLHFSSDDAKITGDPLAKIRNVNDYLREKFANVKYPGKELSLDESMISWRGRLLFRKFIKNKKHKYGIKIFKICTADGYVLTHLPYVGKKTVPVRTGESVTAKIVMTLMEKYLDSGHELYMDNYYNSVNLGLDLLAKKTHMIGTLRPGRKLNPKKVIQKRLKKGEVVWGRYKSVIVSKWKDKKDVLMISTKHINAMVNTTNRRGQAKDKPECVTEYNKFMGGVDRSDQRCSYNTITRRSKKWYRRYFYFLLDTSIVNAFLVAKDINQGKYGKYDITKFREELVQNLCPGIVQGNPTNSTELHYLDVIPQTGSTTNPTKACRQCKKRKSRYQCPECTDCPALCVTPCFKIWHPK